jgi:tRNA threonylcarbamoyladenosine biosynthesis protein TsaB
MEVYSAVFCSNLEKEVLAEIITEKFICRKHYILLVIARKVQIGLTKENYIFLDEVVYPSAKEMSFKLRKIQKNDTVDVAYFEPYYLKDFMITTPKK